MKMYLHIRLLIAATLTLLWQSLSAHPLGVFSTNQYTKIQLAGNAVRLVYVIDIAEIPSVQELRRIDRNQDQVIDDGESSLYAQSKIAELVPGLRLIIDGETATLTSTNYELTYPVGQGGLKTTRLSTILETPLAESKEPHAIHFANENLRTGFGWKEIVIQATQGEKVLESSVPNEDVTNELRSYPADQLQNPLNVSEASVSFLSPNIGRGGVQFSKHNTIAGSIIQKTTDNFAELILAGELDTPIIIVSLLIAFALGAGHALTPGHGKTIVAAYLVGSRGTAKHAAFLGLTVTATHTIGVFAIGLIALFASQYVLPEMLFPWLGLISGIIVVAIGISLFMKRLRFARGTDSHHNHSHGHEQVHEHSHDGRTHTHTHLPPGANGTPVTWRILLALGVSGGLLPCPSAIVVLLSAVALGRIGFGLLLILAFSFGLASVLTGIGILMVYARKFFERFKTGGPLFRWLPVVSATVVALAGCAISIQAFGQTGIHLPSLSSSSVMMGGALTVLVFGFILGLKHALDADHLVAVSTIVSERKGFLSSSIVGALWGIGHTTSLLIAGLIVIALHIQIPEKVAALMEFAVAGMLVFLGIRVLWRLLRGGTLHLHLHTHDHHHHVHPHLHPHGHEQDHTHEPSFIRRLALHIGNGKRSIFIGMVHGMAGSAALMLVVLATIPSAKLALLYVGVFGVGSIGGMLIMSTLIGIPFVLTAQRSDKLNVAVRGISGVVSVVFGLYLAWQIGVIEGLFLSF